MSTHYFIANVALPNKLSLQTTAEQLNSSIPGLFLTEEETGKYEEVPAYVASLGNFDVILFGIPLDEVSDAYVLEVTGEIPGSINEFRKVAPPFISQFLIEKEANQRGFVDYSEELVNILRSMGYPQCEILT